MDRTLAFIGGGNMAGSLIGGLIADGWDPDSIRVADPDSARTSRLAERFAVITSQDNSTLIDNADAVILAVKPQVMHGVIKEIAAEINRSQALVISIAAGIRASTLADWLGAGTAIVRCMPNTPALVQSGATALYANPQTSEDQRSLAESVLRAVGLTLWVDDEAQMDTVTALSGSGPAYFFLFMEALQAAGSKLGLPADSARLLALQTAFGAAKMALESREDAATLRHQVTSPGGTTEQAIATFQQAGLEEIVLRAVQAAAERSRELAAEFGEENT
ncbi:MAG: pyrroline-5-carboxylate reductase [Pseudomonadota bacterium]